MSEFYDSIPIIIDIKHLTEAQNFVDAPEDWFVAVTDVIGSTRAINDGKYKEINTIAVSTIAAIVNIDRDFKFAYSFGGDGAAVLIPPHLKKATETALAGVRDLAKAAFKVQLRAGLVPVSDVYAKGKSIKLTRLKLAEGATQAIFMGGGVNFAEDMLKQQPDSYSISDLIPIEPDFTGLECRWKEIPGKAEEVLSIIVTDRHNSHTPDSIINQVLIKIEELYGDAAERNPIQVKNLSLSISPDRLKYEAKMKQIPTAKLVSDGIGIKILQSLGINPLGFDFEQYKQEVLERTDNEKYDDVLRMVITGSTAAREQLTTFLDQLHAQGKIFYGTHVSTAVTVTCLVMDRHQNHVHFVDGNDGGYAKAAKQMKQQMKATQQPAE